MVKVTCVACNLEMEVSEREYEYGFHCTVCGGYVCEKCLGEGKVCPEHKVRE